MVTWKDDGVVTWKTATKNALWLTQAMCFYLHRTGGQVSKRSYSGRDGGGSGGGGIWRYYTDDAAGLKM